MKDSVKKLFIKYILTLTLGCLLGIVLLLLAFLLPVEPMRKNMGEIADSLIEEGTAPQMLQGIKSTQLDNFTDRIMIMAALYDGDESTLKKAMAVYNDDMGYLKLLIEGGKPEVQADDYAHYWHGYLVILKPLLLFMNYYEIRLLNECFIMTSLVLVAAGFAKKNMAEMMVPYILAMSVLHPMVLSMSMQYSTAFFVMTWLLLYLIYFWDGRNLRDAIYAFFIGGMALCYFDLLTYPLIVYGIPCVYALQKFYKTDEKSPGPYTWMMRLVHMGFSSGIGYALMFGLKWILALIVVGPETVRVMREHLMMRFSSEVEYQDISRTGAIMRNLKVLGNSPYFEIMTVMLVVIIYLLIKRLGKTRVDGWKILAMSLIMISPAIWWFVFANHSYMHYFFTYRSLAVEVFALFTIALGNTVSIKSADVV